MKLVHESLERTAALSPSKPAVIDDRGTTSYEQLLTAVRTISGELSDRGVRAGDRVLVCISDKTRYIATMYAAMASGAIAVPLPEGAAGTTIEQTMEECSPAAFMTTSDMLASRPHLQHGGMETICLVDRLPLNGKRPRGVFDAGSSFNEGDSALILYTSGSTGLRKPVLLSHANLVQATLNINAYTGIGPETREYVSVPLTHSFGFGRVRCLLDVGGTVVVSRGLMNPAAFAKAVVEHGCNAFSAVPSGIALFAGRMEQIVRSVARRIAFIELGSAPMGVERKRWLADLFPNACICMHYGLTEASRSTFLDFRRDVRKLETVGRATPNVELRVEADPSSPSGEGEILVRGLHVAAGYWKRRELTSSRFLDEGWFRTGDFGKIDDEGFLNLLGRKDDMINMGGTKISPLEVENALRDRLPFADMCVVGIPDPSGIMGELPALCYVSKDDRPLTLSSVYETLSPYLDTYKMPRVMYRVEEIPRTDNGKARRDLLRTMVGEHAPRERSYATE